LGELVLTDGNADQKVVQLDNEWASDRNHVTPLPVHPNSAAAFLRSVAGSQGKAFQLVQRTANFWRPVFTVGVDGRICVIHAPTHISSTRRARRAAAAQRRKRGGR